MRYGRWRLLCQPSDRATERKKYREIESIKPYSSQFGFLIVRTSGGKIRLLNQFDGFHDFILKLKTANPAVELRGCYNSEHLYIFTNASPRHKVKYSSIGHFYFGLTVPKFFVDSLRGLRYHYVTLMKLQVKQNSRKNC